VALLPAVRPGPVRAARAEVSDSSGGVRSARLGPLTASLALLALTAVLVLALLVGGGRPAVATQGLPDAGAVTGWGQPLVALAVRLLAVLTVGQLAYAALLAPAGLGAAGRPVLALGARRALRWSAWSAAGWVLAEVAALVLTASALYGVPVTDLSVQGVLALATRLPVGGASLVVGLLLVAVLVGARLVGTAASTRSAHARPVLLAALAAVVAPVVLAGHSAVAEDHVAAVVTLSVHVVTASLWVGGLVGLLLHGRDSTGPGTVAAVRRFSALALGCVALLLVSGVAVALLVAGAPSVAWLHVGWVRLLAVKTILLVALTGMGWWHRRSTLPLLAVGRSGAFVRLAVVELGVMAAAVTVSVALAASPAPAPDVGPGVIAATGTPQGAAMAGPVADAPAEAGSADGDAEGGIGAGAGDMSGHDHGDLSVSVLVDEERFHVAGTVRPGQPVTVYNGSDSAATITAGDGSFDVEVPARTFITFEAPTEIGDHDFISRPDGLTVDGFADTLLVRVAP